MISVIYFFFYKKMKKKMKKKWRGVLNKVRTVFLVVCVLPKMSVTSIAMQNERPIRNTREERSWIFGQRM